MNNLTKRGKKMYTEVFAEMDTDNSGYLCLAEVESLCARLGFIFSDDELKGLFGELDANKDGKVSCDEFLRVVQPIKKKDKRCAEIRRMFRQADVNKDGVLTVAELYAAITAASQEEDVDLDMAQVEQFIAQMDSNGDGVVDYEEFMTLLKAIL